MDLASRLISLIMRAIVEEINRIESFDRHSLHLSFLHSITIINLKLSIVRGHIDCECQIFRIRGNLTLAL